MRLQAALEGEFDPKIPGRAAGDVFSSSPKPALFRRRARRRPEHATYWGLSTG